MPGTRRLIFGGSDFQVYDVDLAAEKPEPKALGQGHESYVTGLAVAGNRWAVSGGYDGKLIWWDLEAGEQIRAVEAHAKWIRDVARDARRHDRSPASPTTWSAGSGTPRPAASATSCAGTRR